jgi:hypothetical protein
MQRPRIRPLLPARQSPPASTALVIGPRPPRLSLLLLLLLLLLSMCRSASAAWQQIADWTDCGSTNFETTGILVDFNYDSFWLNMTVEGLFFTHVVDSNASTNKASTAPSVPPPTADKHKHSC